MDKDKELFDRLGISTIMHGNIILIPRNEVSSSIEKVLEEGIRLLGFDAFKLHDDGKIQPFMEFSAEYSKSAPEFKTIKDTLNKATEEITHYEVVIDV